MKKTDKLIIALLLCAAVFCAVKFVPNKQQVAVRFLENLVKISVREGQTAFVQEHLSIFRLLRHEMGNPLVSSQGEEEKPVRDLSQTDADVEALRQKALKKSKTVKVAGKVVERTIVNMTQQVSSGEVKVQNRTDKSIDIDKIVKEGANLKIADKTKPTVLIYHTHTHECYVQLDKGFYMKGETTQSADSAQNVVRVGDAIVDQLEKAGFSVIHDTAVHDDDYNNSYVNSGKAIDKILKQYPTIEVTIDIHRDSVGVEGDSDARTSLVKEIAGKKAAQVMIISGCEENAIKDFPDWYDNLHFALGLQKQFSEDFPGLARPLYFADRKYNMYKTKNSVLIEVGSDGNTLEQAVYSGKLVGATLVNYLGKYVQGNS